ncbi:MAG: gluconate 2-dehydrogenase subunit 3 family protein [Gemmatimonadaceae bacterium]
MSDATSPWTLTRRELLGATASALLIPLLSPRLLAAMSPFTFAARFFTPAEFAMVDELSEIIIPTDDHSPGARAARVAGEIDRKLSESETERQIRWRSGLQSVDALSVDLNGKRFMQATPDQRLAVLTQMAAGEEDPKTPAQRFFGQLKGATGQAYYTSKIGIHVDQQYKGNVYQQGEYAGFDVT